MVAFEMTAGNWTTRSESISGTISVPRLFIPSTTSADGLDQWHRATVRAIRHNAPRREPGGPPPITRLQPITGVADAMLFTQIAAFDLSDWPEPSLETLSEQLAEKRFAPTLSQQVESMGWAPVVDERLALETAGA
ncbi:MAG: recombination-associated protein RdgC, partial [Guyparkeria sp.]